MFLTMRTESPRWLVAPGSTVEGLFSKLPDFQMLRARHTLQACFNDIEWMNNQSRNNAGAEAGDSFYERRRQSGTSLSPLDWGVDTRHRWLLKSLLLIIWEGRGG